MRRFILLSIILMFLVQMGCVTFRTSRYFAPPDIIENVADHIVSIAVYYYMPEEEYQIRLRQFSRVPRVEIDTDQTYKGERIKCIAYIGSGTVGLNNHIITVRHLFDHDQNTYKRVIWVFREGLDHPVNANLVAISTSDDESDDYAVIEAVEDLGLPGIRIAKKEPRLGEKVMFGCSVGGSAFLLRFGWMSRYKWFFRKGYDGQLHLSKWVEFHYNTTYPSGPGDSGAGIFNINGELVGVMYLGINVYEEMYCFANPLQMLKDFLEAHKLLWLAD